jgi:hypothetical protein
MSDLNASRTKHKSILSSLTDLGASELPVKTNSVPRNSVLASVAAAGASLLACQSAGAGTIDVFNPNVNVGFAAGDINNFKLSIGSLSSGLKVGTFEIGVLHSIRFKGTVGTDNSHVHLRTSGAVAPAAYGKKFSQIAMGSSTPHITLLSATVGGLREGADFSEEYYAFSFEDTSHQTHYGWIYGTLTGAYSDMSYNLISWAYDTAPNVEIGMGFTGASTPEPSSVVLGAMAALILGAAGVRKRNKAPA